MDKPQRSAAPLPPPKLFFFTTIHYPHLVTLLDNGEPGQRRARIEKEGRQTTAEEKGRRSHNTPLTRKPAG